MNIGVARNFSFKIKNFIFSFFLSVILILVEI